TGKTPTLGWVSAITINNGTINFASTGNTLDAAFGVTGANNGTINVTAGAALVYGGDAVNSFTNTGSITAANGSTVPLGNTTNKWSSTGPTGLISVNNATLNLSGTFTNSSVSNFSRTGGTVNLTGTVTGGLTLNSSTGSWNLVAGKLSGGHFAVASGSQL